MAKDNHQDTDNFLLRLPDGMRDTVAELARVNGRSMNAQFVMMVSAQIGDQSVSPEMSGPTIEDLRTRVDILKATSAEADRLLALRGGALRFYELSIRTLAQSVLSSGKEFDPALCALLAEWADYRGMFPDEAVCKDVETGSGSGE